MADVDAMLAAHDAAEPTVAASVAEHALSGVEFVLLICMWSLLFFIVLGLIWLFRRRYLPNLIYRFSLGGTYPMRYTSLFPFSRTRSSEFAVLSPAKQNP